MGSGGIGSFLGGFSESFNAARKNKTLRDSLQLEEQRKLREEQIQQQQFQEKLQQDKANAAALNEYRQGQLDIQQKQLQLQQKQADVTASEKWLQFMDPTKPKALRMLMMKQYAKTNGIDTNSQDFKDIASAVQGMDDEQLSQYRTMFGGMIPNAPPGMINAFSLGVLKGQMPMADALKMMEGAIGNQNANEALGTGATSVASGGTPQPTTLAPTDPQSRLLSSTPMALQAPPTAKSMASLGPGGTLPVPGMGTPPAAQPTPPAGATGGGSTQAAPPAGGTGNIAQTGPLARRADALEQQAMKLLGVANRMTFNSDASKRYQDQARILIDEANNLRNNAMAGTKPAEGEAFVPDNSPDNPTGMRAMPVPGSKLDLEQKAAQAKVAARANTTARSGNIVIQDIGRAVDMMGDPEKWAGGITAGAKSQLANTDEWNINNILSSIGANISVDNLKQMRAESPSGGAIGNASDQDMLMLQRLYGSINLQARGPVLYDNLRRIQNLYMDIVNGTPEEIKSLVDQGKLTKDQAKPLMQRYQLSVDNLGHKVDNFQYNKLVDPTGTFKEDNPPPKAAADTSAVPTPQQKPIMQGGYEYTGPRDESGQVSVKDWQNRDNWVKSK